MKPDSSAITRSLAHFFGSGDNLSPPTRRPPPSNNFKPNLEQCEERIGAGSVVVNVGAILGSGIAENVAVGVMRDAVGEQAMAPPPANSARSDAAVGSDAIAPVRWPWDMSNSTDGQPAGAASNEIVCIGPNSQLMSTLFPAAKSYESLDNQGSQATELSAGDDADPAQASRGAAPMASGTGGGGGGGGGGASAGAPTSLAHQSSDAGAAGSANANPATSQPISPISSSELHAHAKFRARADHAGSLARPAGNRTTRDASADTRFQSPARLPARLLPA